MKKKIVALLLAALCGLFLLTACEDTLVDPEPDLPPVGGDEEKEPTIEELVELVAEKYEKIAEAKEIDRSIEIKHGALTQYESKKNYKKEGNVYTVTGTVKELNSLDAEEPYTTTTVSETAEAGTFTSSLNLNASYFTAFDVKDGVFTGEVSDGYFASVLGIGETLPAPVHSMTLKIATDETHVGEIAIAYSSAASDVAITLTFVY